MPIVDYSLAGKVVLVTGGSKGIGRAIALACAENGADVAIAARGREALDATAGEIEALGRRVLAVSANVGETDACNALYAEVVEGLGGIDILVNNAATGDKGGAMSRLTEEVFRHVMAVNLWGPIRLSQLCRTTMQERGGGMIVNIASNEGVRASAGLGIYSPSKAALINFTQLVAKEWAKDGIRAISIAPGLVRTELAAGLIANVEASGIAINPLKRVGEPEEIAALVLALVSQAGRFATATNYVLDGGELGAGPLG